MSSLLVISNKALRKLGVREINNLAQQGKAADRCNSAVRDIVKEVLREHTWSHATEWKALPQLVASPPFGYEYAYQAPITTERIFDVRQVEDLRSETMDFEMVRGKIVYTDASPCYARYVVNVEADLVHAAADFIDACAYRLAAEIATPLAKAGLQDKMMQGYIYRLRESQYTDAASNKPREKDQNQLCTLLSARDYPQITDAEEY